MSLFYLTLYVVLSDISPSPVTNQSRGRIGSTPTLGHSQYESRYVVLLSIGKPDFQKCWNNFVRLIVIIK